MDRPRFRCTGRGRPRGGGAGGNRRRIGRRRAWRNGLVGETNRREGGRWARGVKSLLPNPRVRGKPNSAAARSVSRRASPKVLDTGSTRLDAGRATGGVLP